MITNGIDFITYKLNNSDERLVLSSSLSYKALLESNGLLYQKEIRAPWQTTPVNELKDNNKIEALSFFMKEYAFNMTISSDIIQKTRAVVLLVDLFMNENQILEPQLMGSLNIVKDGGIRIFNYGNSSGGDLIGKFRYFIVKDAKGENQIISFSIYKQAILGNPYLMVAIDDNEKSHHSLELNLYQCVEINGNQYSIFHNGKMTAGNKGSIKPKNLVAAFKNTHQELICNDKVLLGTFSFDNILTWPLDEVKQFLKNIITYSLFRDNYRKNGHK